jgi:hypothetical protein
MSVVNWVKPKAAAKHELLFSESSKESSLLNKSSHCAAALALTKFTIALLCYLSQTYLFNKPTSEASLLNIKVRLKHNKV